MTLPTDADARKAIPLVTGCLDYFPDALAAVAELSRKATEQHHPGMPMHWDREKSGDEVDALGRHLLERGKRDGDGVRHSTKLAWRALALLQKELELQEGKPLPRAAQTPSCRDSDKPPTVASPVPPPAPGRKSLADILRGESGAKIERAAVESYLHFDDLVERR